MREEFLATAGRRVEPTLPDEDVAASGEGAGGEARVQVGGFASLVDTDAAEVGAKGAFHLATDAIRQGRATAAGGLDGGAGLSGGGPAVHADLGSRVTLERADIEVLAVLAAIDRSPARQRRLAYAQDDVSATHPWISTVGRLFAGEHPGVLAVADDARLRRAELVQVIGDGPWATRVVQLAPAVTWHLAGDTSPDAARPKGVELLPAIARRGAKEASPQLLLTHGADKTSRRMEAARETGIPLLASVPASDDDGWRALVRDATIRAAGIQLEIDEPRLPATAAHWIDRAAHLTWVISSKTPIEVRTLPARAGCEHALRMRMATTEEWAETFGKRPEHGHRLDPDALRPARIAYDGVDDVDGAVRRIHVAVDFREPDEEQRLDIWKLSFPPNAPQEELDLPWLRVTGGNIRNAATSAAFLASDAGQAITMDDVVRGIEREFEKLGRLRTEADLGPYYRIVTSND